MFSNFNSTFKENKKNNLKLPKEIIEILNNELPKDLEYKEVDEGICAIVSANNKPMNIKTKIKLPDIPEKIKKDIHSFEDVYEYLYRAQKKCEIIPDKDGNIIVNNSKIKANDLIKNVREDEKFEKLELIPPSFPKAIKTKIKSGNIVKEFDIERQPYESMKIIFLKSTQEKPISIKLYIKDENTVDLKININIKDLKDVNEIVEVCEFYKGFLSGDIQLGDVIAEDINVKKKSQNVFMDKKIDFWKKVLEIEKKLNIKFNATKFSNKDYVWILKLYKSIIENVPFKISSKINSLEIKDNNFYEKANEMLGEMMIFEYTKQEEIEVIGQRIKIYILERIYNYKVKEVKKYKEKIKLILKEENESFVAQKFFLTEEELKKEQMIRNRNDEKYKNAEYCEM